MHNWNGITVHLFGCNIEGMYVTGFTTLLLTNLTIVVQNISGDKVGHGCSPKV